MLPPTPSVFWPGVDSLKLSLEQALSEKALSESRAGGRGMRPKVFKNTGERVV